MKHDCWGSLDGVYKWIPRTSNPKSCPRCKARLDGKFNSRNGMALKPRPIINLSKKDRTVKVKP